MQKRALSQPQVAAIQAPGNHWVGPAPLYLQIRPQGTRSWLFRYQRQGKTRWMGLGPAAGIAPVTLPDARDKALRLYVAVRDGADPVAERRSKRAEVKTAASVAPTFAWCCAEYIAAHEAGWRNAKHREQWESTLRSYAQPVMGAVPVDQITVDHVLRVLKPIWTSKPETAGRLRGRIEKVLGWAAAKGYRSGENPARWAGGALSHLLPPLSRIQTITPRAAVPWAEVPAVMATLRKIDTVTARALQFTILTAARTGEVLGARWSEVDAEAKVWTVPAERMKSGAEHRVPLTDEALALLGSKPPKNGLLFPSPKGRKPLSNMTMLKCLRGLRKDESTVHGFRASFSTWGAEATSHPREVIEAALAHTVGDEVERAYSRSDRLAKRRLLMVDWAAFTNR